VRPPKAEVERSERIVANIYKILSKHGVAYNPEADMYSGSILYENGLDDKLSLSILTQPTS